MKDGEYRIRRMAGLNLSGQRMGGDVLAGLLRVRLESRAKDGIEVGARSRWDGSGRHCGPRRGFMNELPVVTYQGG